MTDISGKTGLPRLAAILLVAALGWQVSGPPAGGAAAAELQAAGFQTITSPDLLEMLQHKDFMLINVHIPYEGEMAATDAFIPFDQIAASLDRLPADKTAHIVLYCRSGRMSEIAAAELAGLGYTDVDHLAGGMIGWEAAGQPVLHR